MKLITIKKLQDIFCGKLCTILTLTVAKTNFNDPQFSDFFTAFIESIDEDGILAKHHMTGCYNYYSWNNVVGILEEQTIQEDDPKYKEIVEELKNAPVEAQKSVQPFNPNTSQFINPEMMAEIAKQAKNKMIRKQN